MLTDLEVTPKESRASRSQPITDEDAKALLASVSRVIVAKGKKTVELKASEASPGDLCGPTGNFRAPMVRNGKTLLVGFNEEALRALLGEK